MHTLTSSCRSILQVHLCRESSVLHLLCSPVLSEYLTMQNHVRRKKTWTLTIVFSVLVIDVLKGTHKKWYLSLCFPYHTYFRGFSWRPVKTSQLLVPHLPTPPLTCVGVFVFGDVVCRLALRILLAGSETRTGPTLSGSMRSLRTVHTFLCA